MTASAAAEGRPMLPDALAYASRGIHVFPLIPEGKAPLSKNGQHDATTDQRRIRAWWGRQPAANIGIACQPSGLYVVDIDAGAGKVGAESWAALEAEHGATPTLTVTTQSGGRHLYYRPTAAQIDRGPAGRLSSTAGRLGQHIDTRWNGYVVAPPSRGAAGSYVVAVDLEPDELPEWIARGQAPRVVTAPARPAGELPAVGRELADRLADLVAQLREAPEGSGNHEAASIAYRVGGYVAAGQLTEGEAIAHLASALDGWTFRDPAGHTAMVRTIERQIAAGAAAGARPWAASYRKAGRPTAGSSAGSAPAPSSPPAAPASRPHLSVVREGEPGQGGGPGGGEPPAGGGSGEPPAEDPTYREHRSGTGALFRQYGEPGPLLAELRDGRELPLTAGTLQVHEVFTLRGVTPDCTPDRKRDGTVYQVGFIAPGESASSAGAGVRVLDADLRNGRDPEWPAHLGIDPYASDSGLRRLPDAIRAMAFGQPIRGAYNATGLLLRPDGPPVFLRQDAPALTGQRGRTAAELVTQLPGDFEAVAGIRHLVLDDPSAAELAGDDLAAWLSVLDITADGDPLIPALMLAMTAAAPWSNLPGFSLPAVYLDAETGAGKSTLTGLVTAWQSCTFTPTPDDSSAVAMSAESMSGAGARGVLHLFRGHVLPVDDFFPKGQPPADTARQVAILNAIARGTRSGNSDTKAERNGNPRPGRPMRAGVLVTGEAFTDPKSSQSARFVRARLTHATLDLRPGRTNDRLAAAQAGVRAGSRAHSGLIVDGLADLARVRAIAAGAATRVRGWGIPGNTHLSTGYGSLLTGAALIADRAGRLGVADPAELLDRFAEAFRRCAFDQGTASVVRSVIADQHGPAVQAIVTTLRTLLLDGTWRLDGAKIGDPALIDGYAPEPFGWTAAGYQDPTLPPNYRVDPRKGAPIGTVHTFTPGAGRGGRPLSWPADVRTNGAVVLQVTPDDFARLYGAVADRVGAMYLPEPDEARRVLAAAGYLRSAVAGSGANGGPRVLALDLARVLAGEPEDAPPGPEVPEHSRGNGGPGAGDPGTGGVSDAAAGGLATLPGGLATGLATHPEGASPQVGGVSDVSDVSDAGSPIGGGVPECSSTGAPSTTAGAAGSAELRCRRAGCTEPRLDPVAAELTGGYHIGCEPEAGQDAPEGAPERPAAARPQERARTAGSGRQRPAQGRVVEGDPMARFRAAAAEPVPEDATEAPMRGMGHKALDALRGPLAPRRAELDADGKSRLMPPWWTAESPPPIAGEVLVPDAVPAWSRPHDGPTVTLDRVAAWPSAINSVRVGHCLLQHTPDLDACALQYLPPGDYLLPRMPWTTAGLPDPWLLLLGAGAERLDCAWVPEPTATLFRELARAGLWGTTGELDVLDAWTAPDEVRLTRWGKALQAERAWALTTHGRDSDAYGLVKLGYAQAVSAMIGTTGDHGERVWQRGIEVRRVDWGQAIKAHSNAGMFRRAWRVIELAPDMGPVAIQNKDELVIPAGAVDRVTVLASNADKADRRLLIDPTGLRFGACNIKEA